MRRGEKNLAGDLNVLLPRLGIAYLFVRSEGFTSILAKASYEIRKTTSGTGG